MLNKSYIVAGPTASGKSDFAHQLAARIGGVVINADSVQIYRGIENISASPFADRVPDSDGKIDGVPYKLFSILSLTEQMTVVDYLKRATDEYNAAIHSGMPAVFVGGTGFYINALLNGISPIPDIGDDARERARNMVRDYPDAANQLLQNADAETAWHARDPQRTARALEVFLETGRPLSEWQKLPRRGAITPAPKKILILPHRDILTTRIAARIPQMMDGGAMEEARRVIASGWDENRAIGASQLCRFIRGEIDADECHQNWITRTTQYAKRQRTWFKNQYAPDMTIMHVPTAADIDTVLKK